RDRNVTGSSDVCSSDLAQNQHVGVGLVIGAAVKVRENVGSELVPAQVEPMGVGLAAVIKGIEIGHRAGREHSLVLAAKVVVPKRSEERRVGKECGCRRL